MVSARILSAGSFYTSNSEKHWLASLLKRFCLVVLGIMSGVAGSASAAPDLAGIDYLKQSDEYFVWLDGEEQFVFKSLKNGNHGTNDVNSMSFLNFDLTEPTVVKVLPSAAVKEYDVRPFSSEIQSTLQDNMITFTLERPQYAVVVVNRRYDPVLVICANPPHSPPDPADVDLYFGPGRHDIGVHKKLASGDDVYLVEGAIVEGSFALENVEDVTIRGRGMIYCGAYPHKENFQVIRGLNTKNVLIEGITFTNCPGWIISFWGESEGLTVRNVKTLGQWWMNTDGVQTGTVGLLVENCFLQCNDDNFSLNGICQNVEIRNNVLWNIYNGGVFMLGWATGQRFDLKNLEIHDNVVFRAGGCCSYDRKAPFSMRLFGSHRKAENIRFRNITVEDIAPYGRWIDFQCGKASQSTIRDITFENVEVLKTWSVEGEIVGHGMENPVEDIRFVDVRIEGKTLDNPSVGGLHIVNARGVSFQGVSEAWATTSVMKGEPPQVATSSGGGGQTPDGPPREVPIIQGVNLLANPSFEDGLASWVGQNGNQCTIAVVESPIHEGVGAVKIANRKVSQTGVQQNVTKALLDNGPGEYTYAAWARTESEGGPIQIALKIIDADGTHFHPAPTAAATADAWTRTQRTHNITWNDLKEAWLYIEASHSFTSNYFIDDVAFVRGK